MNIAIGTLALAGGLFVLGRYLMELISVGMAKALKGVEYQNPNPLWGAIGFTVAIVGGLLFFI